MHACMHGGVGGKVQSMWMRVGDEGGMLVFFCRLRGVYGDGMRWEKMGVRT